MSAERFPNLTSRVKKRRELMSEQLRDESHRFVVFRLGWDVCAKCERPRKEHK